MLLTRSSAFTLAPGVGRAGNAALGAPRLVQQQRSCSVIMYAKKGEDLPDLNAAGSMLSGAIDSLASFVPDSVPRPAAKTGVAVVGGLVLFGLVQKVISGIFTLALIGGLGYWYLTKDNSSTQDDDDFGLGKKGSSSKPDVPSDPLSDAKRIMDKYK